jgi:hypothetical protein
LKLLTYILAVFIYFQSFAVYAFEATFDNCHKYGQQIAQKHTKASDTKTKACCKITIPQKNTKSICCKSSSDKTDDNGCCGDMCKCQHVNHSHVVSLLPQDISTALICKQIPYNEHTKSNEENLHGYDPLDTILQPPRH